MNKKIYELIPHNNRFLVEIIHNKSSADLKNGKIYYPDPVEAQEKYTTVRLLEYSGEETKFDICPVEALIESFLLEQVSFMNETYYFIPVSGLVCAIYEYEAET